MTWTRRVLLTGLALVAILGLVACGKPKPVTNPLNMKAILTTLDANKDGQISRQEFRSIWRDEEEAEKLFLKLDTDHDGFLSEKEFMVPWLTVPPK
jgi:Ca2+-binding EF-hand superfamily protein